MSADFILWSGWVFGFAGFLFAFWQHSTNARDRRELRDIRRRASAPLLVPSSQRFDQLYEDRGEEGQLSFWHAGSGNVLSFMRDEVEEDMEDGTPVILVIDNDGETAPRIRIKLDGDPVALLAEPDISDAHGLHFISYPFNSKLRGAEQKVELWFECAGIQDTHVYKTEHGRRVLTRTDPP